MGSQETEQAVDCEIKSDTLVASGASILAQCKRQHWSMRCDGDAGECSLPPFDNDGLMRHAIVASVATAVATTALELASRA
jgi:hypothetical protein